MNLTPGFGVVYKLRLVFYFVPAREESGGWLSEPSERTRLGGDVKRVRVAAPKIINTNNNTTKNILL